jgi:hypothetical protein
MPIYHLIKKGAFNLKTRVMGPLPDIILTDKRKAEDFYKIRSTFIPEPGAIQDLVSYF